MEVIMPSNVNYKSVIESLPPPWSDASLRQQIYSLNMKLNRKIIVLDDDPTGSQTVHDLFVLTRWDKEILRKAFNHSNFIFYILTNTRSFEPKRAEAINRKIMENLASVAKEQGCSFTIINRGDSTLRGHYPLEIDVATEELRRLMGEEIDGHLIIPAFFEGKRFTYHDVHYIKENEQLIPLGETEFSNDKAFGFKKSNLCEWIEEKTDGQINKSECQSISVEQLRKGPDAVLAILLKVRNNQPVIVNALCYEDLNVLAMALIQAEIQGKKFIHRTAASFVKSYAGIEDKPYLSKEQMIIKGNEKRGGLIIVGSHVQKTTSQLNTLLQKGSITAIEMKVKKLLELDQRKEEIDRIHGELNDLIQSGQTVVVYTSRELIAVKEQNDNLKISQHVSKALTEVVQSLVLPPKFVIAKGGITSSDIATMGLGIQMAQVVGQAAPGIPVWLTGEEAKFSSIPYIIFPGNVGDDSTLLDIVTQLS
ncbi:four-carbon acid sugar kinase family protein [Bacillus sp. REN10]|uniref:four-carbon acid sugar kinase family protein n=1 Tax=Bacillus sp. REN10 TaxID=2782541 RepID=UPI00193B233F|nr:four-carbon acid sugar kinase family protein [Bacillus sp. REN10]